MNGAAYAVEFVPKAAQVDAALWEACFPPPLEGRWWYETLENSGLERQFAIFYALLRDNGAPVGIAPAFLMDFPLSLIAPDWLRPLLRALGPRLTHPRTLFIGSPCADEGTVGTLQGVDRRGALLAWQRSFKSRAREAGASLLVWKDVAERDAADLDWLARNEGMFRLPSFPGTIVEFAARDKESYWSALKGSRRHQLRKKIRRSREAVALEVEVLHGPDERALDELYGLFRQTYERATTRFEELDRRFFAAIARQPVAYFIVLREPSTRAAVAFMLCFDLGAKVINKFLGFDYGRPREWLLYFRLWDAALDWSLARGASCIQSGQTGYAPKLETGHRLQPLENYCTHRNAAVHALAGFGARFVTWATLDEDLARHLKAHPVAAARQIAA